jgi:membrane protein YqaA with SNARE-associated domain
VDLHDHKLCGWQRSAGRDSGDPFAVPVWRGLSVLEVDQTAADSSGGVSAPMIDLGVYAGLFATALVAATILPAQSEAALVGLLLAGVQPPWLLIFVASVGNVLGSVINWMLGRGIERFRERSWFPANAASLERAQRWYQRYGKWSLLLSWMPIVGDPLTVVAGVLREPLPMFLLLVTISKVGRYLVLAAVTLVWA